MAQLYRKRPDMAADILNSVLEEGDPQHLSVLLRQLMKAFSLPAPSSGHAISEHEPATLANLLAIVGAIKMRLAVIPAEMPLEEQPQISQVLPASHTPTADPVHG